MLKRIRPADVRRGMYIVSIEGVWPDRPFWRGEFLLERDDDVGQLRGSGVEAVVIDTAKGKAEHPAQNMLTPEVQRALRAIELSKPLVKAVFEEAKVGKQVSYTSATTAVEHISGSMSDGGRALIALTRLKSRDEYTFLHSIAVCALMVHLARALELDEEIIRDIGMGGLVHDIGKMRIRLAVLNKAGPLTNREMDHVRAHPVLGHELLNRQSEIPKAVLDICLSHHERIDGKGYPQGLYGDQISLPVKICTICDVYDALTSRRAYKKPWSAADAARFMLAAEGQFDRRLLMRFFHSLDFEAQSADE